MNDAALAAALLACDPAGLGGAVLRGPPCRARDAWLALLRGRMAPDAPYRRLPTHIGDDRLLGGIDLAATLAAGRRIVARGLLADADGGCILIPMAERIEPGLAARLCLALDAGEIVAERDGVSMRWPARFGVVALDEGIEDEGVPEALRDRLAFHLDCDGVEIDEAETPALSVRPQSVTVPDALAEALVGAALALGITSLRAPLLAVRATRCMAALAGRVVADEADAAAAARLVLAPRAQVLPSATPEESDAADPPPEPPPEGEGESEQESEAQEGTPSEIVLDAAVAALPADLLRNLQAGRGARAPAATRGRAGATQVGTGRGRPIGTRAGQPRGGNRLAVVDTLRAAAPWQAIRNGAAEGRGDAKVAIRSEDFRIHRLKHRTETATIFCVDASGSAALHRLAEAKGAVEILLARCYARRDQVAVVAFRGTRAETVLAPTRSLTRARRALAGLPGGGATPLASGVGTACDLAAAARRQGRSPMIVLLTDGRANVGLDGAGGREAAERDALEAARKVRAGGIDALLIDTAPRPHAFAQRIAEALGGRYLALPYADASALSRAVEASAGRAR
ncbi:MAG: magnesium chelatase subunit D [Proteobacteria bacterium]|nr:magnesium chelatase subunit D [Pseudomonadota bacterium]